MRYLVAGMSFGLRSDRANSDYQLKTNHYISDILRSARNFLTRLTLPIGLSVVDLYVWAVGYSIRIVTKVCPVIKIESSFCSISIFL